MFKGKYRLILTTGLEVNTVEEYDAREIRTAVRSNHTITTVTTDPQQADRRRWHVSGSQVVAWRSI